jgi:uncharacterized protein YndB with AHSA1/START domain
MKVEAQITIDRPRAVVWEVFSRPEGWETWWGGALNSVDPGWEEGASLHWDLGSPSTIVGLAPIERVEVTTSAPPGVGQGTTDSFTFTDQGPSSTRVEYEQDSGSMAFGDPAAAQQECSASLTRLKAYVEQSADPGETGEVTTTPAEKPWWKFWK